MDKSLLKKEEKFKFMDNYKRMTETPINRLILRLAVPTVISMMITSIYNLSDSYFVGKIGTSASGAVGIILVLQTIIQAFGFTFGHGSGSIISRKLGEKDHETASKFASTGFFCAIAVGLCIAFFGFVFFTPMLKLMGSTETILPFAKSYGVYILIAAPFMAGSCVLNNIMRYEGRAMLAMIGLTTGGVLNIIGDPIFMFVFKMGISGAGLATALSQMISFCILLYMFLSGKTDIKLSFKNISHRFADVKIIFTTGFPSLVRQGLNSISITALNNSAAMFGDPAVAAMSIVGRLCVFIASMLIGIGQGLQPVAAFNYGAKRSDRVKQAYFFTLKLGIIIMTLFGVTFFIIAPSVIGVFRDDPQVIKIGIVALRAQCAVMPLQPLCVCSNMMFQSIGESKKASFLSTLRTGLYFLPVILIAPHFIGLYGVQYAQAVADALTFLTALPFTVKYFKNNY